MTITVLAHRPTDRTCEKCGDDILELLIRAETLQKHWVIGICPNCQPEPETEEGRKDEQLG